MLDPFQSIAGILDRVSPFLRRAPMVAPLEAADQRVSRLQQPHQHADRVPKKTAVAWFMHERGGDRAVEPHDLAGLDFLLTRAGEQGAIDRLPALGPNGADCPVQHRLLRRPRQRQPGEGAERGGVFQMKRQLLVAQLAMLFEKPATQDRLRRQTLSPGLLDALSAQILRHQPDQLAMLVHGQEQLGLSQAAQLPSRHRIRHLVFEARLRSGALHLARARPLQSIHLVVSRRLQPRPLRPAQADLSLAFGRALASPADPGSISYWNFTPFAARSALAIARWIEMALQTALLRQQCSP